MQIAAQIQSMLATSSSTADLFIWGGVLIVLLVALWFVLIWLRKWYFGTSEDEFSSELWTLADLRRMREQGEITEDEYETLRGQVFASHKDSDEPADAD
ncbi:MAG: SHOCT domain-containing protein [Planctomycetes bacterium]|nr:SHOCT domain-containing protein [Planctomycetota bacterium]